MVTKKEKDVLVRLEEKLDKILEYVIQNQTTGVKQEYNEEAPPGHTVISCDASIKENPGGPSSIGFVIRKPGDKPIGMSKSSPATTNNQAEYDAIYEGLSTFFNLNNHPTCKVEVRSDSQLIVNQLNGEIQCQDKSLVKRRDAIKAFIDALPVKVEFRWKPRNSTADLREANYLAQDLLGVPRH